jgi:hypothetical protein
MKITTFQVRHLILSDIVVDEVRGASKSAVKKGLGFRLYQFDGWDSRPAKQNGPTSELLLDILNGRLCTILAF